jgi:hypothetical protein
MSARSGWDVTSVGALRGLWQRPFSVGGRYVFPCDRASELLGVAIPHHGPFEVTPVAFDAMAAAYQLRVHLVGIEPAIWRRLLVPDTASLQNLHYAIQDAMGWNNTHLHVFRRGDLRFDDPRMRFEPEDDSNLDERYSLLRDVFDTGGATIEYVYDFGDDWRHVIEFERAIAPEPGRQYPTVIGGERACPPEDCGGIHGYEELIEALRNPSHPEHDSMREWAGAEFDPERVNLFGRRSDVERQRCRGLTEGNLLREDAGPF